MSEYDRIDVLWAVDTNKTANLVSVLFDITGTFSR